MNEDLKKELKKQIDKLVDEWNHDNLIHSNRSNAGWYALQITTSKADIMQIIIAEMKERQEEINKLIEIHKNL